ncbi:MAG: serine/threonine protein kinase, partial [Ktedonobacteraceae bacterium]
MANGRWQEVELQQIGTYTVTGLLSTGPTSSLYIGKHRKKEIIIKVFHPPLITLEAKEAFLARAKQLKKLKHRYIIDIQDYGFTQNTQDTQHIGKEEDHAYIVMQFVPAGTVRQNISPGQCLRSDEVKRMLSPLASALHYAHVSNILHGNLHPGNLLVDTNNDILLTDFSLSLQSAFPSPDAAALAIPYMAPEQLQGTLMAASDQYSLAVMVYEWLCGQRPFEATGREKLLHQQEHDPLPAPGSLNADISPAIERVLLQALAHNPGERFQHTQAFADNYLRALMGLPLNIETRYIGSTIPTPSTSIGDNTKANKGSVAPIISSVHTPAANKGIKGRTAEIKDQVDKESKNISVQSATTLPVKPTPNDKSLHKSAEKSTNESFTELPSLSRLLNQRYHILNQVGKGGFGTVYKAEDTKFNNRPVALKELSQSGLSQQKIVENTEAFKREVDLLAGLMHPNLPRIYDYFEDLDCWYFVMDFIEGQTLEEYLKIASGGHLS